jgi:acid phosphatase (class A)
MVMHTLKIALSALVVALAAPAYAQAPAIDAVAVIGPPPATASSDAAADRLDMRPAVSAERLAQARADQVFGPWSAMHPVLGDSFTEARLPHTAKVFADLIAALGPGIGATKNAYGRPRPYAADPRVLQCDAPAQSGADSPSYPSGHAAGGWAWALVLAELMPARADALLQRGRDYGESRVICGFHFPSDVAAGRVLAAATIARLHAEPGFRRDLDAARRELARAYP